MDISGPRSDFCIDVIFAKSRILLQCLKPCAVQFVGYSNENRAQNWDVRKGGNAKRGA